MLNLDVFVRNIRAHWEHRCEGIGVYQERGSEESLAHSAWVSPVPGPMPAHDVDARRYPQKDGLSELDEKNQSDHNLIFIVDNLAHD